MKRTSKELHAVRRGLEEDMLDSIRELLEGEKHELECPFEDDANNMIRAFDSETVYCDGTEYPLNDLSIDDGLYILSILED